MHYRAGGWQYIRWTPLWWLCGGAAIAVLICFWVASATGSGPDSSESILKRPYAGGESTGEEYARKLEELRH
jgi:uncharacterized membrane protein